MGMRCSLYIVTQSTIDQWLANPALVSDFFKHDKYALSTDIEKSWHGLHYLLTGSAWEGAEPLNFLVKSGKPIGEKFGYGPARYFPPEFVERLDDALSDISTTQLWQRFDKDQMEALEIYPLIWDEPEEDLREEYGYYLSQIKSLIKTARQQNMSLIVLIG